jgi:tryptophan synthase alpha chain
MSRIDQTFRRLKDQGRRALIPFVVAGDPNLETTQALVYEMAERGADIIELGVPFSDPLADGPTIQNGSQRALQNGTSLKKIFSLTKGLKGIVPPLVLMTYFNPVFQYGLEAFAKECRKSGIEGVIIPDLPPEEAGPWVREAREVDLDTIFLIAPTSPPERIKKINASCRGFIYYVSVTGVTGVRRGLPEGVERSIKRIREESKKPIAFGFGVSGPDQVRRIIRFADGVIVGSAIVKIIEENLGRLNLIAKVGDFISTLTSVLNKFPYAEG